MKSFLLLLAVATISVHVYAQAPDSTHFILEKKRIDSLVISIDSNKQMTHSLSAGHLMWGSFKANCYYIVGSSKISKMECFFEDSTVGKKVFYYDDNLPVRIIDKNATYYYTNASLVYPDGKPVKPYVASDIVFFSKEVNKMMLGLME